MAGEGAHKHQQRRFREMEIRDQPVGDFEVVGWEDELVGPSAPRLDMTVRRDARLHGPAGARADYEHVLSAVDRLVDDRGGIHGDLIIFRVHLVLRQVLDFDGAE